VSLVLDRPVLTIGRGARSDLVLVDSRVSRGHARIRRDRGGTILQDLGSTNGTFLNGQRVRGSHPLRPGDVIRVGRTELVFGEQGVFPQGSGWRGRLALARGRADPGALALRAAGSKVRIGRSRRNDVVVADDPHVSRYHVEIRHTARGHEVVDLGAGAGVLVNGESVVRRVLRPGDRIRLGSTEFVYTE
jgi:pSer/pThr/pTyr-binding forkhead associated (FHA) protein